jgi:hypothetical protein
MPNTYSDSSGLVEKLRQKVSDHRIYLLQAQTVQFMFECRMSRVQCSKHESAIVKWSGCEKQFEGLIACSAGKDVDNLFRIFVQPMQVFDNPGYGIKPQKASSKLLRANPVAVGRYLESRLV